MSEIFDSLCPYYMSIGMTYNEYWYGANDLCKFYYEAEKLRIEKRNQELWLQGLYNHEAVSVALYNGFREKGKSPQRYRDKPIELFPKPKQKNEAEIERKKAIDFFEEMRLNYMRTHGEFSSTN